MKLRNKKTGKISEVIVGGYPVSGKTKMWECSEMDTNEETGYKTLGTYTSLAELNEEWEDYEEPKEDYWYITEDGTPGRINLSWDTQESIENHKSIGNYFETYEEAEKAVEKLKAWKRLKDNGFRFEEWTNASAGPYTLIWFYFEKDTELKDVKADLDLLFGGEE